MYEKTSYKIKLNKGYLDPISSNLGLKQGCPLSPMLFNLYIDDIKDIFDSKCDPIPLQNENIYHFLYADDLVLISSSAGGLQRSLNKLGDFAETKSLTVSIKKSKSLIFNTSGILLKSQFNIKGNDIEPVNTFCYLGFELAAYGTVKHAMKTLLDKAKKALRPLMCTISRFNLPSKTALKLFHTYIAPIALYSVENWATLPDKKLKNHITSDIFEDIDNSKIDVIHRKLLKYTMGVSKSCPNMAIYGETGEIPLSLKGYRLIEPY